MIREKDKEYLDKYLDKDKLKEGLIDLEKGIPVQYIVGNVDFYGNIIQVNSSVLIPRFETELLVEKTSNYIKKLFKKRVRILDIGTGSGCIAISLKKLVDSDILGVDISKEALEVAKKNALGNEVEIDFRESDIYSQIDTKEKFEVIISNPPYIREDEEIEEIVRNNEPHLALYAKERGLYFYKKILEGSKDYLDREKNFLIALEIGKDQGEDIKKIALEYFNDIHITVENDYNERDRFVLIWKEEEDI